MKRFYLILAAIAAMTMTAQAQIWGELNVGDFDNASTLYNGSYFDMAPTNFYVAHTGVQMLYTADMLADLQDKPNLVLNGITFKYFCDTYEDITRSFVIFIQETDATEFAVNEEGIKQFFPIEGDPVVVEDRTFEMIYMYGDDATLPFRFNLPYTPGKGLLVTLVADAYDDDNCTMGSDYAPFYTTGFGKAMTYTNNWTGFYEYTQSENFPNATATLGCGTNVNLPVTKFSYMYMEKTGAPTFNGYTTDGIHAYFVEINPSEPSTIWYRVRYPDGNYSEWAIYEDILSFTEDGNYRVEAYAIAEDKAESDPIAYEFVISPITGLSDMLNTKTVASTRYFNAAGQEMQEANGLTIVVTTYTDGTTSTVKVVK